MTKVPTISEEKLLQEHGYKLLKKIGEGGYAKVFLGEFRSKNSEKVYPLACKVINTRTAPDRYVNKFLPREMKILIKLNHPHIVHIHSIFQREKIFFIFMRYAEKGDLLDFLLANGALKERQARVWTRQLALAVQYLHTLEIAHRDLKCENVLVTSNYNVKLADFGFSRWAVDKDHHLTLSETYCGSLQYAPPEIIKGIPYQPKIADMWSLGIVVYTMLNKSNPFNEKNHRNLYNMQVNRKWRFRTHYVERLSEEAKELVTNLLEPTVTKRYTIDQVLDSEWIAMDSTLKLMNAGEFKALSAAIEAVRTLVLENRKRSDSFGIKKGSRNKRNMCCFERYCTTSRRKHIFSETFCGSLMCAPPEIITGTPYEPKIADMWSFGIMVYTMLNKANPFNDKDRKTLVAQQKNKKWKFRSKYENVLSSEVKSLIRGLLDPDVKTRLTIDQVINSNWIGMDPKLKVLNAYEFAAITAAIEEVKASGDCDLEDLGSKMPPKIPRDKKESRGSSWAFLKQIDQHYIRTLDRSKPLSLFG